MVFMRVLFVCSGNICRSPIAEGIAAALPGVDAASAGSLAMSGSAATEEAVVAAALLGVDIGDHRSRPLDSAHVAWADLVFGMESRHLDAVARLGGSARLLRPDGDPIDDPYGLSQTVYHEVSARLADAIRLRAAGW